MTYVVKTFQQLETAIRENAEEIIIVGGQAHEILKAIGRSPDDKGRPMNASNFSLGDNFEVLEIMDNNLTVEGVLRIKPKLIHKIDIDNSSILHLA